MQPLLEPFVPASPTSSFLPGFLMFLDVPLRCWLFYLVCWHLQALLSAENPTKSVRVVRRGQVEGRAVIYSEDRYH